MCDTKINVQVTVLCNPSCQLARCHCLHLASSQGLASVLSNKHVEAFALCVVGTILGEGGHSALGSCVPSVLCAPWDSCHSWTTSSCSFTEDKQLFDQ